MCLKHTNQHGHNNHGQRELKPARPRTNNPSSSNIAEPSDSEGEMMEERNAHPLQIAGSRLPDCSHACGSCSPCKLVIVSSLCAALSQAAETCPVSYRCMCNNKSYPVP
ncbi:conserved hypothetical protein [Ricinus communis]|uniref:Epidermal patterning factor-like protein n=1 Tax=Ricinus communis TaxID=3988 RepID=B9T1A1_RICCO|nr:conserved hypothetical protein [Ricinus communis]